MNFKQICIILLAMSFSTPALSMEKVINFFISPFIKPPNIFEEIERGLENIQPLLDKGIPINCTNEDGDTPLHIAIKEGYGPIAKALIDKKANVNFKNKTGLTPLHLACLSSNRCLENITQLIHAGANANDQDNNGQTPLHYVSHRSPATPNTRLYFVYQMCQKIKDETDLEILQFLINNKAQINCQNKNGVTPLHIACHDNQPTKVELLLNFGANIYSKIKSGHTPFQLSKSKEVQELLIHEAQTRAHINFSTQLISLVQQNQDAFSCTALSAIQRH